MAFKKQYWIYSVDLVEREKPLSIDSWLSQSKIDRLWPAGLRLGKAMRKRNSRNEKGGRNKL
jgi:hypothetical protein